MISVMNEQLRRIVLTGTIREDTSAQFLEQITALECIDVTKTITIYIDTYGGSAHAAMSIYDAMRSCNCPITTVGIGKVMSAGVLILAAGDKGNRFLTENARVMIHEVGGGVRGSKSEMEVEIEETKRLQDMYVNLLVLHAGVNKEKLEKDMSKIRYMSAKEAKKYGLADVVVPTSGLDINKGAVERKKPKKNSKKKKK